MFSNILNLLLQVNISCIRKPKKERVRFCTFDTELGENAIEISGITEERNELEIRVKPVLKKTYNVEY